MNRTLPIASIVSIFSMSGLGCATAQTVPPDQKAAQKAEQMAEQKAAPSGGMGFVKPAAPIPTTAYIVDLPSGKYKSKKFNDLDVTAQLLFLDEDTAKKAFSRKDEVLKILADAIAKSKADFKSDQGKIALKADVMCSLMQKGYNVSGVLWNEFMF